MTEGPRLPHLAELRDADVELGEGGHHLHQLAALDEAEVGRHGRKDRPQPDLRAVAALALDRLDHRVLAEEAPRPEVAEALVVPQHLDLPHVGYGACSTALNTVQPLLVTR